MNLDSTGTFLLSLKMFDELLDLVQNLNGRVRWTNMPLIVDKFARCVTRSFRR